VESLQNDIISQAPGSLVFETSKKKIKFQSFKKKLPDVANYIHYDHVNVQDEIPRCLGSAKKYKLDNFWKKNVKLFMLPDLVFVLLST
jgi:hypothetical protein